jgi:hypothetical protein
MEFFHKVLEGLDQSRTTDGWFACTCSIFMWDFQRHSLRVSVEMGDELISLEIGGKAWLADKGLMGRCLREMEMLSQLLAAVLWQRVREQKRVMMIEKSRCLLVERH